MIAEYDIVAFEDCRCSLAGNARGVSLFQFESQGKDFFFFFLSTYISFKRWNAEVGDGVCMFPACS